MNPRHSELVIGLVYPLGTERELVVRSITDYLKRFDYRVRPIRVSDQFERLPELRANLADQPENRRIETRMEAGNKARELAGRDDFAVLAAISQIAKRRDSKEGPRPFLRTVLLIDSLKRPEEVAILRRIYGEGFFLIGLFASEASRFRFLSVDKGIEEPEAKRLMQRDLDEADPHGQRTTDTFHEADVFISLEEGGGSADYKKQLWRFIDLVFGDPHRTPTLDEHAMHMAYAGSFRSADLSRQVGAAITSPEGDLIAVGCNDVPRYGGGQYWPGEEDQRDYRRGFDSNHVRRQQIVDEVLRVLDVPEIDLESKRELLSRQSPLKDITEYGRAVHAEMEALLSCARNSRSPRGGTLYSTTFPCHNCTRHIVAAGIHRVVYVEPYPKSKASELHGDAIELTERGGPSGSRHVHFEPFVGITARRYMDLFSLRLGAGAPKRRKTGGRALDWSPGADRDVRVPMWPISYLEREKIAVDEIDETVGRLSESRHAPSDQGPKYRGEP